MTLRAILLETIARAFCQGYHKPGTLARTNGSCTMCKSGAKRALVAIAESHEVRSSLVALLTHHDANGKWWVREAAANEKGPMPGFRPWVLADTMLKAFVTKR